MENGKFIIEKYAKFVCKVKIEDIPQNVIEKAREVFLDFIGVAIHGAKKGELSPAVFNLVQEIGSTKDCLIIGTKNKAHSSLAAFANGVSSHTIELDDGHRFGTSHPSVAIIPAAISSAEEVNASYKELLRAIILGYEIMLRVAVAINPSHLRRGFHTTGTTGPLGASIAAACIYNLNKKQTAYSLSISGLQGAGFQEMLFGNPMIKPLQPGKAAMAGIISAKLALKGVKGPLSLFEGSYGYFKGLTDHVNESALFDTLGKKYEIMRIYTKPYPTCRHTHCSIDLALKLIEKIPHDRQLIEEIIIETYAFAIKEVGQIWYPKTKDEAMFSIPYAVAVVLLEGKFTIENIEDDYLSHKDIQDLASKVKLVCSEEFDTAYPDKRAAKMTIKLKGGTTFIAEEDLPKGEKELPLTREELKKKFRSLAKCYLSEEEMDEIWFLIIKKNLEKVSNKRIFQLIN